VPERAQLVTEKALKVHVSILQWCS